MPGQPASGQPLPGQLAWVGSTAPSLELEAAEKADAEVELPEAELEMKAAAEEEEPMPKQLFVSRPPVLVASGHLGIFLAAGLSGSGSTPMGSGNPSP